MPPNGTRLLRDVNFHLKPLLCQKIVIFQRGSTAQLTQIHRSTRQFRVSRFQLGKCKKRFAQSQHFFGLGLHPAQRFTLFTPQPCDFQLPQKYGQRRAQVMGHVGKHTPLRQTGAPLLHTQFFLFQQQPVDLPQQRRQSVVAQRHEQRFVAPAV